MSQPRTYLVFPLAAAFNHAMVFLTGAVAVSIEHCKTIIGFGILLADGPFLSFHWPLI
jgi:hypothetical protein